MRTTKNTLFIVIFGLFIGSTTVMAEEKSATSVINNAYNYIDKLQNYAFDAIVIDKSKNDGNVVGQYKHTINIKVARPNRLRVDIKGDLKNSINYLNNGTYTIVDYESNYYGELKTPKNINQALDFIFDKYGIRSPLATLIYTDMSKRARFTRSKYFGKEIVSGVECDYIAFKNSSKEIHIWVATGDKPIVKYYTEFNEFYQINTTIFWNENPQISNSNFIFTAPTDAVKISIESAN